MLQKLFSRNTLYEQLHLRSTNENKKPHLYLTVVIPVCGFTGYEYSDTGSMYICICRKRMHMMKVMMPCPTMLYGCYQNTELG